MPGKIQTIVRELRRGEYAALRAFLSVDPAELTRATWAKRIESYDAVPPTYQNFFVRFAGEATFPYTLMTPSYAGFIHSTAEKLVCIADRELYVLEEEGESYRVQCYPLADIYHLQVKAVLLDSYVALWGRTKSGTAASTLFRFNSVGDVLVAPILETIRRASTGFNEGASSYESETTGPATTGQPSESDVFDNWMSSNYKFMNYAKRSLLEGEKVVYAILHPEVREKVITIFGKTFYRMLAPTQAVILTDREMIVIREGERRSRDDKYGGTWDYIPLNKITSRSLSEKENDLLALSIGLPENTHLTYLFEASAAPELQPLLA